MQHNVAIVGQIGTTPATQTSPEVKGVELSDIMAQARAAITAGATILVVGYNSPGGYVEDGDQIYNYLQSLKSDKLKVYSTTIPNKLLTDDQRKALGLTDADVLANPEGALVGSIATKDYLAGEKRFIGSADAFFIHNPWMNPGPSDATKLFENAEKAQAAEDIFRAFYAKATNNPIEALKPLMDQETSLDAGKAIALGFATNLKTDDVRLAAFIHNKSKKAPMSKDTKTIGQKLDAILASVQKAVKGAQALTVKDAAGVAYFIDAPDLQSAKGQLITLADADGDSTGNAAPDGPLSLADGSTLVVKTGKIDSVTAAAPAAGAPPAPTTATPAQQDAFSAFQKSTEETLAKLTAIVEKLATPQASVEKLLDTKILALKKEIGTVHKPARVQMTAEQRKEANAKLSPIARKMRGIKEEAA